MTNTRKMGKAAKQNKEQAGLYTTFKYGMPVYGLGWPHEDTFYMCGGGGMGIKNRVVGAQRVKGMLTDQVVDYHFDENCPMRLTVLPNGKSMVLAMAQGGLKRLDIDSKGKLPKLTEASGDFAQRLGADKTEIKCLAFNPQGDALIVGGVDGSFKIMSWPSLDIKLHLKGDSRFPDSIRDVAGAPAGSHAHRCAVVLDNGTAEIWDWDTKTAICKAGLAKGEPLKSDTIISLVGPGSSSLQALPKDMAGARFASLRYGPPPSASLPAAGGAEPVQPPQQVLYALMNNRNGSWVLSLEQDGSTGLLRMLKFRRVSEEPSSCLDVSADGQLLAVGTSQAVVVILSSSDLSIIKTRTKAHSVFCTGICFSPDSQHVLSVSGDASATLTSTQAVKKSNPWKTTRRVFTTMLFVLGICMAILLQVVRELKRRGNDQAVEKIGDVLRAIGIVKAKVDPDAIQI